LEKRVPRKIVRSLVAGLVTITAIGVLFAYRHDVIRVMGGPASSAATPSAKSTSFYLDMGASSSLGTQPDGIPGHNGRRTNTGYSDDLVTIESKHGMALTMREIGCPGETVQSILGQLKDRCYKLPTTQLTVAITYLKEHSSDAGVVTVDMGFNNIRPCLTSTVTIVSCVNQGIVAVRNDLPTIIRRLQNAAGPRVHFIGLGYGDPFLAFYLRGSLGRVLAAQGLVAMNRLNAVLQQVYGAQHVAMANVAQVLHNDDATLVTTTKFGVVPQNVASTCAWTWMCAAAPFGPDDHPNVAGYSIIAHAIVAKLPPLS
jgi:hypothetical protein